ncbi:MAG: hypothetical protein EA342_14560 [Leptolyngbya sp. LCM1.Bin17]|nr:MAG: hypothetical protein EA342_14560 [Leptolyngbya sp. LCM1.Bin17]
MGEDQRVKQPNDYSPLLQALMQRAGLSSYRALSRAAGVSRSTLTLLRQGQVGRLQVVSVQQLAQALGVTTTELLVQFDRTLPAHAPPANLAPPTAENPVAQNPEALWQEYERLQQQLEAQPQHICQQVQREAIAILEPWLLQWPTAIYAAQQNPTIPATRLIPLTKPLDALLQAWGLTAIGPVGAEVPYDPQQHQPMGATITPGQQVRIRYAGYQQGDRLLYRAKVSPVES